MKLTRTHSAGGDCTAPYNVDDYHEKVADFVGIVDVKAVGGWTWMAYTIKTSTPPPKAVFIYQNPFTK